MTLVLEEIQVAIALGDRIVYRMRALVPATAKRLPGLKSMCTVKTLDDSSNSTDCTDHGAAIPRAASNSFAVMNAIPSDV